MTSGDRAEEDGAMTYAESLLADMRKLAAIYLERERAEQDAMRAAIEAALKGLKEASP